MSRRSSAWAGMPFDKRHLINLSGVSILAMDEFAIHKGHRYATVIIDPTIIGRGRGRRISARSELLGTP